jgi:general secretion pathway protein G
MTRDPVPYLRSRRSRRSAFTLLEMMLVIALIGLLVGVGVANYDKIFGGAQAKTTEMFIEGSAKTALASYRFAMGNYPTTAQGLAALITAPEAAGSRWAGPYLTPKGGKLPEDSWGRPYQYRCPGTKNTSSYDLFSLGADGQEGTADDVTNW